MLADLGKRRRVVLWGGAAFAASLLLTAISPGFWVLLLSFVLFYPASGAFVNVSQAQMMDREPRRREQNMARWTFAGSVGALAGPLALGAASWLGAGWRAVFAACAVVSMAALAAAARAAFPASAPAARAAVKRGGGPPGIRQVLRSAARAVRKPEVVRWLVLLELANLMMDVLFGFLALYFVEAASVTPAQAALAVSAWTGAAVLGDLLLIPLLEGVNGLAWLRVSAAAAGALYPCFLLAPPFAVKLALVAALGLVRAGWYPVLQARLYAALPGRSGVVIALGTIASSAGALIPIGLGMLAEAVGLRAAMWALLAAPAAILLGLPRPRLTAPASRGRRRR